MIITKQDIEQRFHLFNKAYFEGKLPTPRFQTYTSKCSTGGCLYYPHRPSKNKIEIARNVDWSEEDLTDVILHEMIHLDLFIRYPEYDKSCRYRYWAHGGLFREEARRISRQCGVKIHVRKHIEFLRPKGKKPPTTVLGRMAEWIDRYIL